MFNWLKQIIDNNPTIAPTVNLANPEVKPSDVVYLKTSVRNYTKEEFDSFINELKSLDDDILRINISSTLPKSVPSGHSCNVGLLSCRGTLDYYYNNHEISIDLNREPAQYYINLCKNLKYLSGKAKYEIDYHRLVAYIPVYDYVSTSYDKWFYDVNNFCDGSTFSGIKFNFNQDTNVPERTINISLGKYDETDLVDKLSQIKPMKSAYIEYHYNKIKNDFDRILNQFPDQYYLITVNDGQKQESMYALNPPEQDVTGSYRIDNVLFREGYFVLIPAVMYRINIWQRSKIELTNKLISSCNSQEIRAKLSAYFGVK